MTHTRRLLLISLLLVALIVAACGGDDGDDDSPAENGPPITDDTTDTDDGSNPPLPPDLPQSGGPPIGGDSSGPPIGGQAGSPGGQSGPPVDNSTGPPIGGAGQVGGPPVVVYDDFSSLPVGESVNLTGTARVLDETDANGVPITVLVDSAGVEVRYVGLPQQIATSMDDGRVWQLFGTLMDAGEDGRLVLQATTDAAPVAVPNANAGGVPPFDTDSQANSGSAAFPGLRDADMMVRDITVDANLTALAAYDVLNAELGDELVGAELVEIRGSGATGWNLRFIFPEEDETTMYQITNEGVVGQIPSGPIIDLPVFSYIPFDRAQVVVDSDVAGDQLLSDEQADNLPFAGLAQLSLQADADGNIVWVMINSSDLSLDATTTP